MAELRRLSRRQLFRLGGAALAAGALGVGVWVATRRGGSSIPREQPFAPGVFLAIDREGVVTVWITKSEMGQGVRTSLAMIVADELGADWSRVRIEQAPADERYGWQGTMASSSVRSLWIELRRAGAAAREMLAATAASRWGVDADACEVRRGEVTEGEHRASFRELVLEAAERRVPSRPTLRAVGAGGISGTTVARLDTPSKVDGSAVHGLDVRLPGQRFAVLARAKEIGARLARFDERAARAVSGVREVVRLGDDAVAVVADTTWAAMRGRDALAAEWSSGPHASESSERVSAALEAATQREGTTLREAGDVDAALASAARVVDATYAFPYLAHATMEPLNCTAWRRDDGTLEIWAPTQDPQGHRERAAELAGLAIENVTLSVMFLGGGFGRRASGTEVDEAVRVACALPGTPVQVVWTREDDIALDTFRPAAFHRLRGGLDASGRVVAWSDHLATPVPRAGESDEFASEGARELAYAIPSLRVSWTGVASPIRTGIWRSVAHSYDALAIECFVDELARAAGREPLALRRELLAASPRHLALLDLVAPRLAEPLPEGRARGLAIHACFGSTCAQVAEVSRVEGRVRVHRVLAAVDVGTVINPGIVRQQIEGGIVFGLSAALYGRIDVVRGRVTQTNFHDYPVLRIDECPEIEVRIVESDAEPGGVGELAVPMIAPAVANALLALEGRPTRALPLATS